MFIRILTNIVVSYIISELSY